MASVPSVAYALDFDGVVCDSVGESSQTALRAAAKLWPDLNITEPFPEGNLSALRKVRPVIETGYENVLLGRLVHECPSELLDDKFVNPILDNWAEMRDFFMEQWSVSKDKLIDVFGTTRDEWIENDINSWVSSNRMFPGVVDALNFASAPLYVITTKQTRFCSLLLKHYGVSKIPEENIFGLGTGSKISVLKKLLNMPHLSGKTICFVEDRYETLEAVSLSMLGQPLELYLATWGYNTSQTCAVADKHPFVELIDLPTFVNKLQ